MTQLTDLADAVDSAHQRKTVRRGRRVMTTAAGSHAVEAPSRLHALGVTTVVAGILGAASAIVIIAWPDQVSHQHYSYPFDATALFGPLVAGRLAIGVWMLMFAALGVSLVRADLGRSR